MVVVLNFSRQMEGIICGHVILRSGHHPRVGFENQNDLCRDLWWEMYLERRLFLTCQSPGCFNTIELSERGVMAGRRGERVLVRFSESGGIERVLTMD
jgi:hypothetical protein